jgi:transcriptional adapter 2-alpha
MTQNPFCLDKQAQFLTSWPITRSLFACFQEQDLCSQFRLLPAHYLKMKETLMLESMKRGQVSRQDAYHMFKVDPIKTDRVYELLVAMGWIQGDAPTLV